MYRASNTRVNVPRLSDLMKEMRKNAPTPTTTAPAHHRRSCSSKCVGALGSGNLRNSALARCAASAQPARARPRRARARAMASSELIVLAVPSRRRSMRREISTAHASGAVGSGVGSRLSASLSAKRARSVSGSSRASCRIASGSRIAKRLARSRRIESNGTVSRNAEKRGFRPRSTWLVRIDATECLVGSKFKFCHFRFGQRANACRKSGLRNGPHLKREGDGIDGRAEFGGGDQRRPGELCSFSVGREGNDQYRMKNARQDVALPDDDRPLARLFSRTMDAEVGPPKLSSLH